MQLIYRCGARSVAVTVQRQTPERYAVTVDGVARTVDAVLTDAATLQLVVDGRPCLALVSRQGDAYAAFIDGEVYRLTPDVLGHDDRAALLALPQILAPMPGKVLQVLVHGGQEVAAGDGLLILEAMKMEHRLTAPAPARVGAVHVEPGQMVDGGAVLVELIYDSDAPGRAHPSTGSGLVLS